MLDSGTARRGGIEERAMDEEWQGGGPAEEVAEATASPTAGRSPSDPLGFAALAGIETLYHAKRALRRAAEANGFGRFALLTLAAEASGFVAETLTTDWPDDPAPALGELAAASRSLRSSLLQAVEPFAIPHAAMPPLFEAPLLCLPLFAERARGVVLFAGGKGPDAAALRELHLFALYLFARLARLMQPEAPAALLSARETECLRWCAAGRTSPEIAAALGVSEKTVNSYLAAAAQKLGSTSRVQTVAKAIRLGLLG